MRIVDFTSLDPEVGPNPNSVFCWWGSPGGGRGVWPGYGGVGWGGAA